MAVMEIVSVDVCVSSHLAATEDYTRIISDPQAGDIGKGRRDGEVGCQPKRFSVVQEFCVHHCVTR